MSQPTTMNNVEHWRRPPSRHPIMSADNLKPGMMIETEDHRGDTIIMLLIGPAQEIWKTQDVWPQITSAWAYTIAHSPVWDDPDDWETHMTRGGPQYPTPWTVRLGDGWAHWWVADEDNWTQL